MSDHNKCPSSEKEHEKCIFCLSYFHRIQPNYVESSAMLDRENLVNKDLFANHVYNAYNNYLYKAPTGSDFEISDYLALRIRGFFYLVQNIFSKVDTILCNTTWPLPLITN